jgi:predicted lysophospholipase L1 biosynthesis ABC-type transport system permease subunit
MRDRFRNVISLLSAVIGILGILAWLYVMWSFDPFLPGSIESRKLWADRYLFSFLLLVFALLPLGVATFYLCAKLLGKNIITLK